MKTAALFDELAKVGAISNEQAERALERYESLERSKPTVGQIGRYAGVGAVATPAIGALSDAISGKASGGVRGHLGRAVAGALTSGAIPIARAHLDRRAEMGTLKRYIGERGVSTSHQGHPTAGKLSEPFEPVEKTAAPIGRALHKIVDEIDPRLTNQVQQEILSQTHDLIRGKEKDSGSGITPARPWSGAGYTVDLAKSAFATSAYSANLGSPRVPQKSFQPGFRAPNLMAVMQTDPQRIKTGGHAKVAISPGRIADVIERHVASNTKLRKAPRIGSVVPVETPSSFRRLGNFLQRGMTGQNTYNGPSRNASSNALWKTREKVREASDIARKKIKGQASNELLQEVVFDSRDPARHIGMVNGPFGGPSGGPSQMDKWHQHLVQMNKSMKVAAGAPTPGNFMMASEVPAFRAPNLRSATQSQPQQIVTKLGGVPTTPAGILASAKRVGAPRVTTPPGPSIAQVVGYEKPLAGATKGAV